MHSIIKCTSSSSHKGNTFLNRYANVTWNNGGNSSVNNENGCNARFSIDEWSENSCKNVKEPYRSTLPKLLLYFIISFAENKLCANVALSRISYCAIQAIFIVKLSSLSRNIFKRRGKWLAFISG